MFSPTLPHARAKDWLLSVYVCCVVCLTTVVEMDNIATPQTCEDLACENGNACHSTVISGTPSGHAYCRCRGEWAGLRCDVKLLISTRSVTTNKATLEMSGKASARNDQPLSSDDLYILEMSVAVWNLNISDHCLILRQRNHTGSLVTLEGLIPDQEYMVCVTNGLIDSCSFRRHWPVNVSKSSNCIYFETKLFDEPPFEVGVVAVPCALLVFMVVLVTLMYCKRRSLLVQLCLNKACCRNCYCFRKHIRRRRRLMHKQRDISGDVLMPSDDLNSASDNHTELSGDSSHRRTRSSNASSSTSRRSACSLDPDGSVLIPPSFDHNKFLYEDQSLIPPLYSPQDHKVMTLTYIDEDCMPAASTDHIVSNFTDQPQPDPFHHNHILDVHVYTTNNVDCNSSKPQFVLTRSELQENPVNNLSKNINVQNTSDTCNHTGPVKPQYLIHPYLHRPYDKSHLFHHRLRSNHPGLRFSSSEFGVRFRDPNLLCSHKRPFSLPFSLFNKESSNNLEAHSSVLDGDNLKYPDNAGLKYIHQDVRHPALLWPKIDLWPKTFSSRDYNIRSVFEPNPNIMNHLLSSPTRYESILKENGQENKPTPPSGSQQDTYISNTLPRSRKPRFVLPPTTNNIRYSWLSDQHRPHQPFTSAVRPRKPPWLNSPIQANEMSFNCLPQPVTPVEALIVATTESKSQNKHVRSLISHFEHNLSFLKPSKSKRTTDEEKEFRDLQSPLAEERGKVSKKSRRSSLGKNLSVNKSAPSNDNHRYSLTLGVDIFEGHPSEHVLPPFSTDDEDEDEESNEASTWNDASAENSSASPMSDSKDTSISCYDDDDTNLVTPFVTDDSSDDDTYKDVNSLSGSMDTLQDDHLEAEHSLLT